MENVHPYIAFIKIPQIWKRLRTVQLGSIQIYSQIYYSSFLPATTPLKARSRYVYVIFNYAFYIHTYKHHFHVNKNNKSVYFTITMINNK